MTWNLTGKADRQSYLLQKFNFDCICKGCIRLGSSGLNQHESDARRERLRSLVEMLSLRGGTVRRSDLEMIIECIKLLKEESLEHNISKTFQLAQEWTIQLGEESLLEEHGLSLEESHTYSSSY